MLQIGFGELLVIAIVSLIVLGPKRLPEAANYIAKMVKIIRRAIQQVKSSMKETGDE